MASTASRRYRAFAATFLAVNIALLLLVASVDGVVASVNSSVEFEFVHDRYLFYVAPLWLIVLFAWLEAGAPRPRFAAGVGAAFALILPFFLPFSGDTRLEGLQHINAMATTFWTGVDQGFAGVRYVSGGSALLTFVLVLVLAALILPARGARLVLPVAVLAVFAVTAEIGWYLAAREADNFGAPVPRIGRSWVDESVAPDRSVTLLVASRRCRPGWLWPEYSFYLTEFFNRSVERVAHVGLPPDRLPHMAVRVATSGRLVLPSGSTLRADYVITQPGVNLVGRRVGEGTFARLILWEVGGAVRTIGFGSTDELEDAVCRHRPPDRASAIGG